MVWVKNVGGLSNKPNINVILCVLIMDKFVNRWYGNHYHSFLLEYQDKNKRARVCLTKDQKS